MTVTVAVINASTVVSDNYVRAAVPAFATQVTRDLTPVWSLEKTNIVYVERAIEPPQRAWLLVILDDTDQASAAGYHDLTPNGLPISKVFAKTAIEYGDSWTVDASHELCEMLCNPWLTALRSVEYDGKQVTAIQEVCDPVESDRCGYKIGGVLVSDFVTPAYFNTIQGASNKGPFDFRNVLTEPMSLATGGYMSLKMDNGQWGQVFGDHVPMHKRIIPHGSRRERLFAGHRRWRRSTPRK